MVHGESYVDDPNGDEITFLIVAMTEDAVLLSDGEIQDWCPRSQIREGNLLKSNHIGTNQDLHIATWILRDKGWV